MIKVAAAAPAPARPSIPVPKAKLTTTLTLTDTALLSLMSRPDLKSEFPFMRVAVPRVAGSCCGGAREVMARHQSALDGVKRALIAMTPIQKARFKELTRSGQVVVFLGGTERFAF